MTKIKNITQSSYGVRTKSGVVQIEPGQVYADGEYEPHELANIEANKAVFEVGDNVVAETSRGANGSGQRIAALEKQNAELTAENADLKAKLAKFDGDGNGSAGGSAKKVATDKDADKPGADADKK